MSDKQPATTTKPDPVVDPQAPTVVDPQGDPVAGSQGDPVAEPQADPVEAAARAYQHAAQSLEPPWVLAELRAAWDQAKAAAAAASE